MMSLKERESEQFWMNSAIDLASIVAEIKRREANDLVEEMFHDGIHAMLEMAESKLAMYATMRLEETDKLMNAVAKMQVTLNKWIRG
tara:strand:+ start:1705 stop:1965 length:261 start_codon:yes stop_codon:yes gene_type:complete